MEDEGDGRLQHKLGHEDKEFAREKHKSRDIINFKNKISSVIQFWKKCNSSQRWLGRNF